MNLRWSSIDYVQTGELEENQSQEGKFEEATCRPPERYTRED